MVQDYHYLNEHTVKNNYLLPLILKQPNKPVYRTLGNPTRGKVTESKVTVEVDLAVRSIGNWD